MTMPAQVLMIIPAKADDNIQSTKVSHVQLPPVGEKYHVDHDDNTLRKMVY